MKNDSYKRAQHCLSCLRKTCVGLQSTGLSSAEESLKSDKDAIEESGIDRQELLSWPIQMLKAAAGQAMKQNNPGAVVGAIR